MSKGTYSYTAGQQRAIADSGYVWIEKTFPNGEVMLHFKKTDEHNPYVSNRKDQAFFPYSDEGWTHGWGRFQRADAWQMAYERLVLGVAQELPVGE